MATTTATLPSVKDRVQSVLDEIVDRLPLADDRKLHPENLLVYMGRSLAYGRPAQGGEFRDSLLENPELGEQFLDTLASAPEIAGPAIKIARRDAYVNPEVSGRQTQELYKRNGRGEITTNLYGFDFQPQEAGPLAPEEEKVAAEVLARSPELVWGALKLAVSESRQPPLRERQQVVATALDRATPEPPLAVEAPSALQAAVDLTDPTGELTPESKERVFSYQGFDLVLRPDPERSLVGVEVFRDSELVVGGELRPDRELRVDYVAEGAATELLPLQEASERLVGSFAAPASLPDLATTVQAQAVVAVAGAVDAAAGVDAETAAFLQEGFAADLIASEQVETLATGATQALSQTRQIAAAFAEVDRQHGELATGFQSETLPAISVLAEHYTGDRRSLEGIQDASQALAGALAGVGPATAALDAAAEAITSQPPGNTEQRLLRVASEVALDPNASAVVQAAAEVRALPPADPQRQAFVGALDNQFGDLARVGTAAVALDTALEAVEPSSTDLDPEGFARVRDRARTGLQQFGRGLQSALGQVGQALDRAVSTPVERGRDFRTALEYELERGDLKPLAQLVDRQKERGREFAAAVGETFAPLTQRVREAKLERAARSGLARLEEASETLGTDVAGVHLGEGARLRDLGDERFALVVGDRAVTFERQGNKITFEEVPGNLGDFLRTLDLTLKAEKFQIQAETLEDTLATPGAVNRDDLTATIAALETAAEDVTREVEGVKNSIPVENLKEPLVADAIDRSNAIADDESRPLYDRPAEEVLQDVRERDKAEFITRVLPELVSLHNSAQLEGDPSLLGSFTVDEIEGGDGGAIYEVADAGRILFSAAIRDRQIEAISQFNLSPEEMERVYAGIEGLGVLSAQKTLQQEEEFEL